MRKLVADKKGKASFIAFGVVAAVAVIAMTFFVVRSVAFGAQNYDVAAQTVFYDKDDKYVQTTEDGTASQQWSGEWNVKAGSSTYQLNKQVVLYNEAATETAILGDGYRVFQDGSVQKVSGRTAAPQDESSFYKLADRNYLVVAPSISTEDGSFTAEKYLIVRLDKAGNAWLANDTMNVKTVQAMQLSADGFTFDVASEKLVTTDADGNTASEVDLSKINGSSNEYSGAGSSSDEASSDAAAADGSAAGVAGGDVSAGGSATAIGGSGGSGSSSSGAVAGGATSGTGSSSSSSQKQDGITPSITLTGSSTGVTSITFGYNVYDPTGKYASVFALIAPVSNGTVGEASKVLLNAGATSKTVYGLNPNTVYRVTLGYTMYKTTGGAGGTDQTADFITTTTKPMGVSVTVTQISSSKVVAKVKTASGYRLDSAKLVLTSGGAEKARVEVDTASAAAGGWTYTFDNPGGDLSLSLSEVYYQGNPIELSARCQVKNNLVTTKTS